MNYLNINHLNNYLNEVNLVVFKWAGIALLAIAVFLAAYTIASGHNTLLARYWARYVGHLDRRLRSMFIWIPGRRIALGQLGAMVAPIVGMILYPSVAWVILAIVIVIGPYQYIERLRQKRIEQIETQIDALLVGLANALKSIPSISAAFISVLPILKAPISEEIDLAIKEMRVGSTLDQALLNMAGRVESRQLDSALSAIMIGRQVGGNLPEVLETSASTLREMARLEGIVRTKTAEGKMQMWVLAAVPLAIVVMFDMLWEGYFHPLQDSIIGMILIVLATLFWGASIILARKITTVDI